MAHETKTTHHEAPFGTKYLMVVKNLKPKESVLLVEGRLDIPISGNALSDLINFKTCQAHLSTHVPLE
jgi:hypothetical protein